MKKVLLILSSFIVTQPALASWHRGVIVTVTEDGCTIQPEYGDKITIRFGPDMGDKHNKYVPRDMPLGATPDQIKGGMKVRVFCPDGKGKDGVFVCRMIEIIIEHVGPREIVFSPMLAKGKETVPECTVRVYGYNKPKRGEQSVIINQGIVFKDGTSLTHIREEVKEMLSKNGWKVKGGEDGKLIVEGAKGYPVMVMHVEAKGLPKDRQPKVRLLDPSK